MFLPKFVSHTNAATVLDLSKNVFDVKVNFDDVTDDKNFQVVVVTRRKMQENILNIVTRK